AQRAAASTIPSGGTRPSTQSGQSHSSNQSGRPTPEVSGPLLPIPLPPPVPHTVQPSARRRSTRVISAPSHPPPKASRSLNGGLLPVEGFDGWEGCAFEVGAEPPVQSVPGGVPGGFGGTPVGVPGGGPGDGGPGGGLSG